jgi:hypothetical protein
MGSELAPVPKVLVKEITVKQVDRNITQLRSGKRTNSSESLPPNGQLPPLQYPSSDSNQRNGNNNGGGGDGGGDNNRDSNNGFGGPLQGVYDASESDENTIDYMANCVSNNLVDKGRRSEDKLKNFIEAAVSGDISEDALLQALDDMGKKAIRDVVANTNNSSKNVWKVYAFLCSLVDKLPLGSLGFASTMVLFSDLNRQLLKQLGVNETMVREGDFFLYAQLRMFMHIYI